MIEVKNLTRRFGSHTAVEQLSFKLLNGRIYGLLGPGGAGKTTTLRMMTGVLAPTEGTVRINGFDLLDEPIKAKRHVGYLPSGSPLCEELTVAEALRFVADAKGLSPERALRRIREVMELTQIEEVSDRLIRQLPQLTHRRVGIAVACLDNPDLIVLDDPTEGLDAGHASVIRALIRRLGENRTVLIGTQSPDEVEALCDAVLILSEGRLVAAESLPELRERTTLRDLYRSLTVSTEETARTRSARTVERDGEYELIDEEEVR